MELVAKAIRDPKQAGRLLTEASRLLGYPQILADEEALITLTETALTCFQVQDENLQRRKTARPLGERATELLLLYTSPVGDDFGYGSCLVDVTPLLYSYGVLSETYGQLRLDLKNHEYGT